MSLPFLINEYIIKFDNLEDLRSELYKKNILTKDYVDEGLMLIYHKYDQKNSSDLEMECRSIVIDRNTRKIISYSCENPLINMDAFNYLLESSIQVNSPEPNILSNKIITKCYEGSLLSLFFKDKWFLSTRRCLNSQDSIWGNEDKSHYNMFLDVLNNSGFETFDSFTDILCKDHCYHFVLIHYQNKNIVDYVSQFGNEYKKLVLAFLRNKDTQQELDLYDSKTITNLKLDKILSNNIFISEKIDSLESFDISNQENQYQLPPLNEGVIIKVFDSDLKKNKLYKLQTKSYQFAKSIGTEKNIFMGLIYLYQKDKVKDYLNDKTNQHLRKILNPINIQESYDTIGVIDALFKVLTSELFELFKKLWDIKTGKHLNNELYSLLPKEYKDILFGIRGLYFKKKTLKNILQINDIYMLLKSISVENFCALSRMRKLMYNWCKINQQLSDFDKISLKCDKIHLKLTAIYCNKLFPNIMLDDLPPIKNISVV
jgi:hypothetical protein